ncbi:MAG: DNA polymerase III subunit delta [Lachnospiraceae bacterium]|nr:DNA polymerase III subunit delta [Lachnospiraceae bacterium]
MQNLKNALKTGEWKRVYLFFGEESYLKRTYKNQVKKAIIGEEDSMNYNYFEGKEASNEKEIMAIADTMPFFADRRLIIVENSGFFKSAVSDEFCDYIKAMPDTVVLLFVENEVDKRSKLYKAVTSAGSAIEMGRQPDNMLIDWMIKKLAHEGKNITRRDMDILLERTGNDMDNINNELDKLIAYTYGRDVITSEDIDAVCTDQINGRIFDMIDAISEKKQKRALELYGDLLQLKEPPLRILFMVARQFGKLVQAKEYIDKGFAKAQIADKLKVQAFVAGKYMTQAGKFTKRALEEALSECADTEEGIKTGSLSDKLGVELLIVKCSS